MVIASRNTFYVDEDFSLEFELFEGKIFTHFYANNVKLSSVKKWYRVVVDFEKFMYDLGHRSVYTVTPNPRFTDLFGGKTIEVLDVHGKKYEVVKWDLKPQH